MNTLHVNRDTLDKYGAVSEEAAKEMAYGAAKVAGTDIGVSTTGIAGPDGGTIEKPVGLAYVCVYYNRKFNTNKIIATGSREIIRDRAATSALDLIRSSIES
jgi:nicotinamide-nucleotide amidase